MTLVTVIIPVYKKDLTAFEYTSLHQCCKVLKDYPIVLLCPQSLDTCNYNKVFDENGLNVKKEHFAETYFEGIEGYNRLLLCKDFYQRFIDSTFILIYQLDAYVFRDELKSWCDKMYDYIGAPLVGLFEEKVYHVDMNLRVGNGGFSLRRVRTYVDFFSSNKKVYNMKQICNRISFWKKPYTRIFVLVFMLMGWRNRPKSVALRWKYNEDDFWSGILDNSRYKLSKPSPELALLFSFERFPSVMYKHTKKLPFGCHAWEKYEYDEFWKKYIDLTPDLY